MPRASTAGPVRRRLPLAAALLLPLLVGAAAAEPAAFSLLAVGDTGAPADDRGRYRDQLAVGAAMAASDRAKPVHGLVLLGDNFYPDGLRAEELAPRLRDNLVRPYCHFLTLAGPRAGEVADACGVAPAQRHPVPLLAILGNHDHGAPDSPALQRLAPHQFVAGWRMPRGAATVYELAAGVSLVAFDSTPVFYGASAVPLTEALRSAAGPWRILLAHHPIANRGRASDAVNNARYQPSVLAAIAESGVRVQLVLSGHEHNLQLLALDPPAPALHVISGGGSGARSLGGPDPKRLAAFEEPGFARVDLVGEGPRQRLVVSLYGLPGLFARFVGGDPELLARRSVDRLGNVAPE
jgi:hypothetical protein